MKRNSGGGGMNVFRTPGLRWAVMGCDGSRTGTRFVVVWVAQIVYGLSNEGLGGLGVLVWELGFPNCAN